MHFRFNAKSGNVRTFIIPANAKPVYPFALPKTCRLVGAFWRTFQKQSSCFSLPRIADHSIPLRFISLSELRPMAKTISPYPLLCKHKVDKEISFLPHCSCLRHISILCFPAVDEGGFSFLAFYWILAKQCVQFFYFFRSFRFLFRLS